jgi:predicted dehydrogenase
MRIDFRGILVDEPEIKACFIGCGSHSFRNIYPTFQFAPVKLVATCDLRLNQAQAYADKFGAGSAYDDYQAMIEKEKPDAVFVVTNYNREGRPVFTDIVVDCLKTGCHVWLEKPPAATVAEIERMQSAAKEAGKTVMVGFKKMFFPGNIKAKELMAEPDFGKPQLVMLQYPEGIPTEEEFAQYLDKRQKVATVQHFLDHLCHPGSVLVYLFGMPQTLMYQRSLSGAGVATFSFADGRVGTIAFTKGAGLDTGMERTTIVGNNGRHIVVDNNIRVQYHRVPPRPPGQDYGNTPSHFTGKPEETTAFWEPEFSLGQLYNKGLFLLGYWGEVNEFARSILEKRPVANGTLEQAWQLARIFECFAQGPGKVIKL